MIVLPGAYQGFNLFTSGSAEAPITFTTAPGTIEPDPAVVIDSDGAISRAGPRSVGFPTARTPLRS